MNRTETTADPAGFGSTSVDQPDLASLRAEIDTLRSVIEAQQTLLADLVEHRAATPPEPPTADDPAGPATVSRRTLFGLAGAGAAGVAVLGSATPAAAAGNPLEAGGATVATGSTMLSALAPGANPGLAVTVLDIHATGPVIAASNFGDGPGIGVSTSSGGPGIDVAHFGTGDGIRVAVSASDGTAGLAAAIEHPENDAPAVNATTAGGGSAVRAAITAETNDAAAVAAVTDGSGPAIDARVTDPGSWSPAIVVTHPGDADAVSISAPIGNGIVAASGAGTGVSGQSSSGVGVVAHSSSGDGMRTDSDLETALVAVGGRYGGSFAGTRAPLRLIPSTTAGAPTTKRHERGELVVDKNGILWLCRTAGTPGSWTRLTPTAEATATVPTPPQILFDAPQRAYDSRIGKSPTTTTSGAKGILQSGSTRRLWLREATDLPAEAAAVLANVTVVNTSAAGFLSAYKTGVARPNASTINWDHAGSIVANAITIKCNTAQQIDVYCAGAAGGTDFIVDVIGYLTL